MRIVFSIIVLALAFSCGKKSDDSFSYLNPEKIEGTSFTLGPWSITIAGAKAENEYADEQDDLGITLEPIAPSFGAIVNTSTGATRMFFPYLKKDSCLDYRENARSGEKFGRTKNGGYWFTKDDDFGNFASYAANIRLYDICLTLNIVAEPAAGKFSSKDSDLIEYFNRFVETAVFRRLGKVHKGSFNNQTYLYTVFFSDNSNETITENDGIKKTLSSAPILTIDGKANEAVSEALFGDCKNEIFQRSLADKNKMSFAVSNPSDDLTSKYSLELTDGPDGTFNRVAEAIYSSRKTANCLIVKYYLKRTVKDATVATSDSELDQMFVEELSNMQVSNTL